MKLNWAERLMVNSPIRIFVQRRIIRWWQDNTALPPGANLLELGCGRGAGAGLLLRTCRPGALHAFDLDPKMIRLARAYLPPEQRERMLLYVGDMVSLPYRDRTMDAVFGLGVLHHVPDWRRALSEIARVLRPGGLYLLEEFYPLLYGNFFCRRLFLHPAENRFHHQDLHSALQEAGFKLQTCREQRHLGILAICRKES